MKIDALYKTCLAMANKATIGMDRILHRNLIPPINPHGIITDLKISVTQQPPVIIMETQFPDYAYFVEHGRGPGKQPPIKTLVEWCRRHSMQGAEFALAKKIGREGTEGKHFLSPLTRMVGLLKGVMEQVGAKVIEEDILSNKTNEIEINTIL